MILVRMRIYRQCGLGKRSVIFDAPILIMHNLRIHGSTFFDETARWLATVLLSGPRYAGYYSQSASGRCFL